MESNEYQLYLDHFSKELSPEIKKYATDDVFDFSRYIFYRRRGKKQHGYCTHCRTEFQISGLSHNTKTECPNCKSSCYAKASGLGRKRIFDKAYFVYYEKSVIDPKIVVARGIHVSRDYCGDYSNVETKYWVEALYVFEMGKSILLEHHYYYSHYFNKQKSVYSLFSRYHNDGWLRRDIKTCCSRESIEKAVKDTPFQYSCWDNYNDNDMVKFFDLYSKYPCIEYLTKLGFDDLVIDKLVGRNTYGAINWRGKTLLKVLRLSKKDLNEIRNNKPSMNSLFLRLLQISKKDGSELNFEKISKIGNSYGYYFKELQKVLKYTTLKKVDAYVNKQIPPEKQAKHYHSSRDQIIVTWKDYVTECEDLMMDLNDGRILFPKNLLEAHQETSKRIKSDGNKLMDAKIQDRLTSLNQQYYFEYRGLMIRPAESTTELIIEGKELNICVGTYSNGYMIDYSKGKTNLLLIRKISEPNKPYYTMELHKDTIKQVQGLKHCDPDKTVAAFIKAFTEAKLTKKKAKLAVSA